MTNALYSVLLAGLLGSVHLLRTQSTEPPLRVTGRVYDLDCNQSQSWCQVLVRDQFVGIVAELGIQMAVEAAIERDESITVYYEGHTPKKITGVVIESLNPPLACPQGVHSVVRLEVDETGGRYSASFIGDDGKTTRGFTRNPRLQSLLALAFRKSLCLGYLATDAKTTEISRAKVNSEDQITRKSHPQALPRSVPTPKEVD